MAAFDDWLTHRSFERRTRELVTPLYRAARALTDSVADAEDLVQDAYIKAFLAFREGEFRGVESCRAWLFRIMVNTFRDQYRRWRCEIIPAIRSASGREAPVIQALKRSR